MPGLARKLFIFAAVDGLILQPHGTWNSSSSLASSSRNNSAGAGDGSALAPVQIEYKTRRISPLSPVSSSQQQKGLEQLESHGVVGLLSVASYSFLISITQRQQVAQILGKPIFVITGVAVIPLSSQAEASKAIVQAKRSFKEEGETGSATAGLDYSSSSDDNEIDDGPEDLSAAASPDPESYPQQGIDGDVPEDSNVVEDVIGRRGLYGRFATRWFSRNGWERRNRKAQGMSGGSPDDGHSIPNRRHRLDSWTNESMELEELSKSGMKSPDSIRSQQLDAETGAKTDVASAPQQEQEGEEGKRTYELMPKLLHFTKMIFSSRSFYFSYDYDITRRVDRAQSQVPTLPLFRLVDPLYFWNRHLMRPFIEGGHHGFVLPLMQGFIGQQEFSAEPLTAQEQDHKKERGDNVEENESSNADQRRDFLLTLISRRSVKRAGVRYLRRGVDDEGNTANSVETEQILSAPSWDQQNKVYSLVQFRGSIPLYFSQSPYYFKPVPIIRHSAKTNQTSFDHHFHDLGRRYGKVKVVCLLDKHDAEVKIGETYENFLQTFNKSGGLGGSDVGFEWFDFHSECRGMKFENVRRLVDSMKDTLEDFGCTEIQDNKVLHSQSGVVRTNCMDCLDRTGVSQCAFGQWALEQQLRKEGYAIDLEKSTSTQWFNILWADNGDAISKQYSSTAALKGDYTRTRKRDVRGALNDLGLTLSRYYNNIVTDYFSQACIDYLLGVVTTRVFDEFELHLESADPGISIEKVRQNAIDTSCQIVIGDETEELVGGWTMLSPRQPNTLRTLPFELSVLLLTDAAVYCCRFDWNAEKVTSFERIELRSITSIKYGTYITSTLTEAQKDEKRNVGLVIAYRPDKANTLRVNTRSLQSLSDQNAKTTADKGPDATASSGPEWDVSSLFKPSSERPPRFIAFKLPPHGTSVVASSLNEIAISEWDSVRALCADIERTVLGAGDEAVGHTEAPSLVEESEIIPLAEARKRTSYLEHLVFDIKKLVWA